MLFPSLLITRGAPGRLMKLEDMQTLLDDFCIPLQLATGHSQKHSMAKPPVRLVTRDIIAYCSNTPSMKSLRSTNMRYKCCAFVRGIVHACIYIMHCILRECC